MEEDEKPCSFLCFSSSSAALRKHTVEEERRRGRGKKPRSRASRVVGLSEERIMLWSVWASPLGHKGKSGPTRERGGKGKEGKREKASLAADWA